ncbi:hypothetical protein CPB86DRAFT_547671 [Serendipita vermifera]|nr:hypothetical protein CPB86DRAFT_547671 [Serendipita vermifera]
MPVSPQLQASARAAYRSVFRAARTTFSGDPQILRAFQSKTRNDFIAGRLQNDENLYAEGVQLTKDIAQVLRVNIVQGKLQDGAYNLRITKDTELGSNETIKNPAPMERPSKARRRAKESGQSQCCSSLPSEPSTSPESSSSLKSLNYSSLKKASQQRQIPVLEEEDLEETFVKGRGPGGQCINKRSTNVDLLHKPTGIRVQCQETRSLQDNRRIARKLILKKV